MQRHKINLGKDVKNPDTIAPSVWQQIFLICRMKSFGFKDLILSLDCPALKVLVSIELKILIHQLRPCM